MIKNNYLMDGKFGIEKEALRVTLDGKISKAAHNAYFNEKNQYIIRDFAESQIEMVTDPKDTIEEAFNQLSNIQHLVLNTLEDEYLWPQSNPPILDDEKIDLAKGEGKDYKVYLNDKYGSKRSLISGIHFNVSFDDKFIETINTNKVCDSEFRNELYLKVLKYFLHYEYIFVDLFSASPIFHESYKELCVSKASKTKQGDCYHSGLSSLRNSQCGYSNIESLNLDYSSLTNYEQSVQTRIDQHLIKGESEIYENVRLKRINKDYIEYLEFRFLDINPFVYEGIKVEDLQLVHLFMIYFAYQDDFDFTIEKQVDARLKTDRINTLLLDSLDQDEKEHLRFEFRNLIDDMLDFSKEQNDTTYSYESLLNDVKSRFQNKEESTSYKLYKEMSNVSFMDYHLEIAKRNSDYAKNNPLIFKGHNNLELSTKIVLYAALKNGLKYEVLDEEENFIRLINKENNHIEYVKEASKTSLDAYSNVLLMENKAITKTVLSEHELQVPKGYLIKSLEEGLKIYRRRLLNFDYVVKPNNTNFGLGISILKSTSDEEVFTKAVDFALSYDNTVIIEAFKEGLEYRFMIIDGKVSAVLHRTAANVVGDGKSCIEELISIKNQDPRRDVGYKTPLEIIKVDDIVVEYLKQQNLCLDSILKKDEIIYLRKNSNISTGGDSIDYTDQVHPSYIEVAEKAAEACNVSITGVDIIIEDISTIASNRNYTILEMNFNPALHIHNYPYIGTNRDLGQKIIEALFPEIKS